MKKVKFKRKSKRIFLKKYFMIFVLFVFLFVMSSAYAIYSERLTVSGTVTGELIYTYYFEKPSNWRGEYLHAHVWQNTSNGTTWPGLTMTQVSGSVYKVEVTQDMSFYSNHAYIIFNDCAYSGDPNGTQTADIPLDRLQNNNQIFSLNTYSSTTKTRLFLKVSSNWTNMYAYMWGSGGENRAWPGVPFSEMSGFSYQKISASVYELIFDNSEYSQYQNIIFNRGSGSTKTKDLSFPPPGQDYTYDWVDTGNNWVSGLYNFGYWSDYISYPSLTPSHSH